MNDHENLTEDNSLHKPDRKEGLILNMKIFIIVTFAVGFVAVLKISHDSSLSIHINHERYCTHLMTSLPDPTLNKHDECIMREEHYEASLRELFNSDDEINWPVVRHYAHKMDFPSYEKVYNFTNHTDHEGRQPHREK